MRDEPVMTGATVLAIVGSILTLLVSFGVDLTQEQTAAIVGFVGVVAPVAIGFIVRAKVSPTP
jgi:predicted amino acid dehydrogenase